MAKIAILMTDLFKDSEFLQSIFAFRSAGHEINHIGLTSGEKIKSMNSQTSILTDMGVKEAYDEKHDALFIPGGYSQDSMKESEDALLLVRKFMKMEKPVFVINHGIELLISACMLAGRRVSAQKALSQNIANAGGYLADKQVIIDGNLVTCNGSQNIASFIEACLDKLSF
jgi:protease I